MIGRPADHSSRLARGELADPEVAERLEAEQPDEFMRRRDFLARTAAIAGAASLASVLPADALVQEAARHGLRPLPKPKDMPIHTVVVLMMENRSFDHYFGWHAHADGKQAGLSYPDPDGNQVATHRLTADFQGCAFRDPDHSWDGGRFQYDNGRMDGFVKGNASGTGSDSYAAGYYLRRDLPFIPYASGAFTLFDRWFCSIMDSTYPNRHYQWGAQDGGTRGNALPPSGGFPWETIFDRAVARGLTARYYYSDLPFAALYGSRGVAWAHPVAQFYEDAAAGNLPNIAFVDPSFVGEDQGTSGDEHPHGDIRVGQAFMSDVVHAFMESPNYRRGVLFIDYDEWGGFFDHVKPRHVPDQRETSNLATDYGFTGFRIPGVCVSPFSRKGGVSHQQVTHESILKLISYRWHLGHLNRRHRHASNIGRSLDFAHPDRVPPTLPDPTAIAGMPCTPAAPGAKAERPKPHDMAKLESSGIVERYGYKVLTPSFDQLFRQPDSVRRALRDSTPSQ
ncbi:MAG TPA: alkaline phosphatase family protein [Solirubrobacterales bacterium]